MLQYYLSAPVAAPYEPVLMSETMPLLGNLGSCIARQHGKP